MASCNCQVMTADELKALVCSGQSDERELAVGFLVDLLTSADKHIRRRGYEFFEEGLKEALFRSCFNYGSLTGGFTDPLIDILARAIEFWATSGEAQGGREAQGAAENLRPGTPHP